MTSILLRGLSTMTEGFIAGFMATSISAANSHPQTHSIPRKEVGHELDIKAIGSLTFAAVLNASCARVRILLCEDVNKDKETDLHFCKRKLKLGPP
jgi:hypothetical protein